MNDLNKIQYIAKKINLSLKEKVEARDGILNFIKTHPVRGAFVSRHISIWSRLNLLNNFSLKPIPAFLSILLILGASGGVSLAAERALPGDLLYPVKVGINEEVRAAVSFSTEAKTHWDTRRLERRLEEAEKLAYRKEFDAEARSKVEANFEAYAERVERRIADFESKGETQSAADLSSNFETSLGAHEKILSKIDGEEVSKFLPKVKAKKGSAALLKIKMESRVFEELKQEAKEAAEGKMRVSENKIEEVKSFIESVRAKLDAEATIDAEARLTDAKKVWADGKIKFDTMAYGEAFAFFQRAHRIAQEAKLLIEAKSRFDVDFDAPDQDDKDTKNNNEKDNDRKEKPSANINADLNVGAESESRIDADDKEVENRGKGKLNVRFDLGI